MHVRDAMKIVEMKLDELTGYKANPVIPTFKNAMKDVGNDYMPRAKRRGKLVDFLMQIEDHGFVAVSYGSFGAVFTHPAVDYVIKLFKHDAPFISFIRYAQQHQDNPHLPRLRGKMMDLGDGVFGLRIEKLTTAPKTSVRERLFDALNNVLDTVKSSLFPNEGAWNPTHRSGPQSPWAFFNPTGFMIEKPTK